MWAFFINVHNMLVLHAYIVRKVPINLKNKAHKMAFLRNNKYKIGALQHLTKFTAGGATQRVLRHCLPNIGCTQLQCGGDGISVWCGDESKRCPVRKKSLIGAGWL